MLLYKAIGILFLDQQITTAHLSQVSNPTTIFLNFETLKEECCFGFTILHNLLEPRENITIPSHMKWKHSKRPLGWIPCFHSSYIQPMTEECLAWVKDSFFVTSSPDGQEEWFDLPVQLRTASHLLRLVSLTQGPPGTSWQLEITEALHAGLHSGTWKLPQLTTHQHFPNTFGRRLPKLALWVLLPT